MDGIVTVSAMIIGASIRFCSGYINYMEGIHNDSYFFGETEFEHIVNNTNTHFVDKTEMIRDVFDESSSRMILITAPRRFGKSTTMNMIRKFLEIDADAKGKPAEDVQTTYNYGLFMDNGLQVSKHRQFFNEHFGKHPVISIDYSSLRNISNYDDMIDKFKRIVTRTYLLHLYILRSDNLWQDGSVHIAQVMQFADEVLIQSSSTSQLIISFKLLARMLCKQFGKKVIVLIDEYDAYIDAIMFLENPDENRIVTFLRDVNKNLLESNECVDRAIVTGTLALGGTQLATLPNSVRDFIFLDGHVFSKYYGLSSDELDTVLLKFIPDETTRQQARETIDDYYNGYIIRDVNRTMACMWSVLQYLQRGIVRSYWTAPAIFQQIKFVVMVPCVSNATKRLLLGESIPLRSIINETRVFDVFVNAENVDKVTTVEGFLSILYRLGYLSSDHQHNHEEELLVKIPNREIAYELASAMLNNYIDYCNFSSKRIENVHSAIDSFRVDVDCNTTVKSFCKAVTDLFNRSTIDIDNEEEMMQLAFVSILATKKPGQDPGPVFKEDVQRNCIHTMLTNKHNVNIFMEVKFVRTTSTFVCEKSAQNAFDQITADVKKTLSGGSAQAQGSESPQGTVTLGIAFDTYKRASIAYSYHYGYDKPKNNFSVIS